MVRYARYTDESYRRSKTPEYDLLLELKSSNSSNLNDDIKNNFNINILATVSDIKSKGKKKNAELQES